MALAGGCEVPPRSRGATRLDAHAIRVALGDESSALDYLYYIQGFESAEAWSSNTDDETDVDGATADWLLTHDWL